MYDNKNFVGDSHEPENNGKRMNHHSNKSDTNVEIIDFRMQPDDHELKNLSPDELSNPKTISKTISKLKKRISSDKISLERGESLYSLLKSVVPRLETVIKWQNLTVEINVKGKAKKILDNVSGEINNLEIVSILGPSGAGKSTLLNSIVGQIKNYTGSVKFYSNDKQITFAYVPQVDHLIPQLTIQEVLLFASKLKNSSDTNHIEEVEVILSAFNLWNARNRYTRNCSGGERKRLSIASEMISKPKILILDEPTTGLDSTTSYIVIEYLKTINKNTTVIATIHQPNSNLFQLFDRCYILTDGKCIYNGAPLGIVEHLKTNFKIRCPEFTNPADLILDIANNVKSVRGLDLIDRLAVYECEKNATNKSNMNNGSFVDPMNDKVVMLQEVDRSSFNMRSHFFREYYELFKRLLTSNARDPQQLVFRAFANIFFPIILCAIMKTKFGYESGCLFIPENQTHLVSETFHHKFDRRIVGLQNSSVLFINMMFLVFMSMVPSTLVLSQYINLVKKEYLNSYYTLNSFFSAIITTNLLLSLIYSFANSASLFYFSNFPKQLDSFLWFWFIVFLLTNIGDLLGLFLSICYPEEENKIAACVLSSFGAILVHVYSGYIVSVDMMKEWVQKFSWFIFCHHTTAAAIKILYGSRCPSVDHLAFGFDSLTDIVKHYNVGKTYKLQYINNVTLKARSALKDHKWNKTEIFDLIQTTNDLEVNDMEKLNEFWNHTSSYVLDTYHLLDTDLSENLLVLFTTLFVLLTICYLGMIYKLRK